MEKHGSRLQKRFELVSISCTGTNKITEIVSARFSVSLVMYRQV